jgi:hypothetical protein
MGPARFLRRARDVQVRLTCRGEPVPQLRSSSLPQWGNSTLDPGAESSDSLESCQVTPGLVRGRTGARTASMSARSALERTNARLWTPSQAAAARQRRLTARSASTRRPAGVENPRDRTELARASRPSSWPAAAFSPCSLTSSCTRHPPDSRQNGNAAGRFGLLRPSAVARRCSDPSLCSIHPSGRHRQHHWVPQPRQPRPSRSQARRQEPPGTDGATGCAFDLASVEDAHSLG